jgi:hypothetical protein
MRGNFINRHIYIFGFQGLAKKEDYRSVLYFWIIARFGQIFLWMIATLGYKLKNPKILRGSLLTKKRTRG